MAPSYQEPAQMAPAAPAAVRRRPRRRRDRPRTAPPPPAPAPPVPDFGGLAKETPPPAPEAPLFDPGLFEPGPLAAAGAAVTTAGPGHAGRLLRLILNRGSAPQR